MRRSNCGVPIKKWCREMPETLALLHIQLVSMISSQFFGSFPCVTPLLTCMRAINIVNGSRDADQSRRHTS
jgi:hypothetical protein